MLIWCFRVFEQRLCVRDLLRVDMLLAVCIQRKAILTTFYAFQLIMRSRHPLVLCCCIDRCWPQTSAAYML